MSDALFNGFGQIADNEISIRSAGKCVNLVPYNETITPGISNTWQ